MAIATGSSGSCQPGRAALIPFRLQSRPFVFVEDGASGLQSGSVDFASREHRSVVDVSSSQLRRREFLVSFSNA